MYTSYMCSFAAMYRLAHQCARMDAGERECVGIANIYLIARTNEQESLARARARIAERYIVVLVALGAREGETFFRLSPCSAAAVRRSEWPGLRE